MKLIDAPGRLKLFSGMCDMICKARIPSYNTCEGTEKNDEKPTPITNASEAYSSFLNINNFSLVLLIA